MHGGQVQTCISLGNKETITAMERGTISMTGVFWWGARGITQTLLMSHLRGGCQGHSCVMGNKVGSSGSTSHHDPFKHRWASVLADGQKIMEQLGLHLIDQHKGNFLPRYAIMQCLDRSSTCSWIIDVLQGSIKFYSFCKSPKCNNNHAWFYVVPCETFLWNYPF